jgi:GT2 family glycosyltransferase
MTTPAAAVVDVVIVNWNTGAELRRCLESIAATRAPGIRLGRVVIVDNASSDRSAHGLDDLPLPITVACNAVNVGFAAACNQGAAGSTADFLLFLNPDTRFVEDPLSGPVALMQSPAGRDIGICGIRLESDDGHPSTAAARYPSARIIVGEATGLGRIAPGLFPRHLLTEQETEVSRDVDQVIGAFFLVRRGLFEQLAGFDERFFVYYEEVDFAFRAARAGYRSHLLTSSRAIHHGGLSSDQVRARRLFYSLRSRLLYAGKHLPWLQRALVYVVTFAVEPWLRLVQTIVLRRSTGAAGEIARAYLLLITDRPFLSRHP